LATIPRSTPSSSLPHHIFSWFLLILANALWATSYVTSKLILHNLSVIMLNMLRMSLVALLLIPLLVVKRKQLHVTWHEVPQLLFVQPLLGTALAVLLLHEQLTPLTLVGGVLIVTSVFLIARY